MRTSAVLHTSYIKRSYPCPCGYLVNLSNKHSYPQEMLQRHHRNISGPLLDRIADIRILKVARTTADPEGSASIREQHLSEAIQYRSLDRKPV